MVLADQSRKSGTQNILMATKEDILGFCKFAGRYRLPDISKEDLKFRPTILNEAFMQDLYLMICLWEREMGSAFDKGTACSIMESMIRTLEHEIHIERKLKKSKSL